MTISSELKTIRDYIRYATSQFNEAELTFGHGTDNAWDEAVALVLHSLHLPHDVPNTIQSARLTSAEREKLLTMIARRVNERVPLAYLTHEAWFCNLPFFVDERVLVPRSPIAEMIEQQFSPWIESESVSHILDLCTGSGCIAIACAKFFPDAIVHGCDLSESALVVAEINALKHKVEDQVQFFHSNLFEGLEEQQYDIIVSNPPYVQTQEMLELPNEYHHEPQMGLVAGDDGLDCVLPILKNASRFLSAQGILVVEVGNTESVLMEKYPLIPFTWLEFQRGGDGVFLLTKEQLNNLKI